MLVANRNKGMTRAYRRAPSRCPLRNRPEQNLADAHIANVSPVLWADAMDIDQAAGIIQTWAAKLGADPTQAAVAFRPDYSPSSWPGDNGPGLAFDSVGEALVSATDMSATSKAVVLVSLHKTAHLVFEVAVEYDRYYAGAGGFSVMSAVTPRLYGGVGVNPNYQDAYSTQSLSAAPSVVAMAFDQSIAAPNQVAIWKDAIPLTPLTTSGPGAAGNFPADSLYIGARKDGAGGLERPFNGVMREVVVCASIPSDDAIVRASRALAYKARIL